MLLGGVAEHQEAGRVVLMHKGAVIARHRACIESTEGLHAFVR